MNIVFNAENLYQNKFLCYEIWFYLTCKDICVLFRCSKQMKKCCLFMNKLIKPDIYFKIKTSEYLFQKIYLNRMIFYFPNIKSLHIFSYENKYISNILVKKYIYENKKIVLSLKKLTIPIYSSIDLDGISNLVNLEYLSLRYSENLKCSDLFEIVNLYNLKYLDLSNNKNLSNEIILSDVLKLIPSINTLDISETCLNGEFFYFIKECININKIVASGCNYLKYNFKSNISYSSHLISINISNTAINDNDLIELTKSLKLLRELYLNDVRTIIFHKSIYEIKDLKQLRILSLKNMKCNNKFLYLIAENLKYLEFLNLESNKYILGDDLSQLLKLDNLKYLNVSDVSGLLDVHTKPLKTKNIKVLPAGYPEDTNYIIMPPKDIEMYRDYTYKL